MLTNALTNVKHSVNVKKCITLVNLCQCKECVNVNKLYYKYY